MVEKVPYDTGLLRNSLTYALDGESPHKHSYKADNKKNGKQETGHYDGNAPKEASHKRAVYIGTNVSYAIYQEYGTSKMSAQPFIRPAASQYTAEYQKIIEKYLKSK